MAFDWPAFLRQNRIEYVTRGQSTSRGNINVKCPMCGEGDTGHHLGISLYGKGWHCWRNEAHSGRSTARLIQLLLRCDSETAKELAGGDASVMPADEDLGQYVRTRLLGKDAPKVIPLKLLPEFKPLGEGVFSTGFNRYLMKRGYRKAHIAWVAETFKLHYAIRGPFAYRIIVPIYDQWWKLQTWTARTILPDEDLRYRALSTKPNEYTPVAKVQPQDTLFGLPYLWSCPDPKVLLIVEGPFDAMWLNVFGRAFGVYATCLFGLNLSQEQVVLIQALQERFDKTRMLLDSSASLKAFGLANSGLSLPLMWLPDTVKDPAELQPEEVTSLCVACLA